jgi:hypothetical protein
MSERIDSIESVDSFDSIDSIENTSCDPPETAAFPACGSPVTPRSGVKGTARPTLRSAVP